MLISAEKVSYTWKGKCVDLSINISRRLLIKRVALSHLQATPSISFPSSNNRQMGEIAFSSFLEDVISRISKVPISQLPRNSITNFIHIL